jgi:TRAP transporter TAXI family solute receptor
LAAHGVTYDDLTELHNTQSGAVAMLADGSADAAFLGGAVPTASITQAATTQEITFVPFDENAISELVAGFPFFSRASIPGGTYRNIEADFSGLNVGSMQFITSAAQSDDTVYEVTRAIYENRDQVVEKHPAGRAIQPKNIVRDVGTEFHPGAIRYYQEIGIWPTAPGSSDESETGSVSEGSSSAAE